MAKQKGPGRAFRRGLSLAEFFALFPDDAVAEMWFISVRWPGGVRCPYCDAGPPRIQEGAKSSMPFRCRDCRKRFSVRTGTVMAETKLGVSHLDYGHVFAYYGDQGRVQYEATPRLRRHAKDGVASGAPHPHDVARR